MASYKAKDFIDAIPGTGGIVATIARRVGCDWHTAKRWIDERPTVAQAYQDELEAFADFAESVLMKSIKDGDTQDAKWYLSRIRRGKYAQRQELTGADGGPLIRVNWDEPDDTD